MDEFKKPYYFNYADVNTLQTRMLNTITTLRPNLDISEGSVTWDFMRSAAIEISRFIQFNLLETAKNGFPQFAYGEMLDEHAKDRLIERKNPLPAFGLIKITGTPGYVIERGTVVQTLADGDNTPVSFETIRRITLSDSGEGEVEVRALVAGISGNVGANTITALQNGSSDIKTITNPNPCTGGTDKETDAQLYERIRIYDQRVHNSYVGSEDDYRLWALEVPGVGSCRVQGCLDKDGDGGDGIVYVSITGSDGQPANERLKEAVYNHLMSPDDLENKLTAVNSKLVVLSPEVLKIDIAAEVVLEEGMDFRATVEVLERELTTAVTEYLAENTSTGFVARREIGAFLIQLYGVLDYENLTLNNKEENIKYSMDQIPVLGEIHLTEKQ